MMRFAGKAKRLVGLLVLVMAVANAQVTVLGWPGGPEETALRAVVEQYNSQADLAEENRVALLFFNRDGFFDKLQADLAAGSQEFDINLLATYAIGRYAPFMIPLELPDAAAPVFSEQVLSTMQFDGQQYGIPTDLSLHFLYYRQDLIDQLLSDSDWQVRYADISEAYLGTALEPKHPTEWTWDDYAATALFFTREVNDLSPTRYGTVLQMKNLLFNMMVWHALPRSYGGDWRNEAGDITIDSDAFRTGLDLYKTLYDAGTTPRDSLSYEYAEANAAFGAGQVATMIQWNAAAGELADPELNPAVADNLGISAPPTGPEGRFTHIHGLGLGLNASAPNPEGARAFLNWLASPAAIEAYALAGGSPAIEAAVLDNIAAERPDLVQLGEVAGNYGFVMDGGTSARALDIYELQAREFTGYWAGTQSLDEALRNVATGMAELLE
jgi:multiple sugar transport system substrate-binding protein